MPEPDGPGMHVVAEARPANSGGVWSGVRACADAAGVAAAASTAQAGQQKYSGGATALRRDGGELHGDSSPRDRSRSSLRRSRQTAHKAARNVR